MWNCNVTHSNYSFMMISRVHLPEIVVKWLSFIPITLFTALVIDGVIQQHDNTFGYTLNLSYIIAIIPTVLLAISHVALLSQ